MKRQKADITGRSQIGLLIFRFKKNRLAMVALFFLIAASLLVLLAPLYIDYNWAIKQNIRNRFQSPNLEHWFGTDQYGRDLFARIIYGGQISLFAGLFCVMAAAGIGILLGGIAGFLGGKVDNIVMRFTDIFMAVPHLLLSMAIVAALGQSTVNMLVALSVTMVPKFTRVMRSSILALRDLEYVEAARCCGTSSLRIILRHLLPNGMGPVIVSATVSLGATIIAIAALGFLGIGVPPPTPEWGTILNENRANIRYYPYLGIVPGMAIILSVLALNLVGDGLRDALDPRMKK